MARLIGERPRYKGEALMYDFVMKELPDYIYAKFEVVIGGKSLARMDEFTKVLLERINLENRAYNGEYDISISIGIAPITDYHSIMDNMKTADERMYVEKRIHHQLSK